MRMLLFALGLAVATAALGGRVEAQNYPWCAIYSAFGGRNCGFTTYEQCRVTSSGMGGFCNVNPMYEPPPGPRTQGKRKMHWKS
jgi:hypothetical protein